MSEQTTNAELKKFLRLIAGLQIQCIKILGLNFEPLPSAYKKLCFAWPRGGTLLVSIEDLGSYFWDSADDSPNEHRIPPELLEVYDAFSKVSFEREDGELAFGLHADYASIQISNDGLGIDLNGEQELNPDEYYPFYSFYTDLLCYNAQGEAAFYFHESGKLCPAGKVGDWIPRVLDSLAQGQMLNFSSHEPWNDQRTRTCQSCNGSGKCRCVIIGITDRCTVCDKSGQCTHCSGEGNFTLEHFSVLRMF